MYPSLPNRVACGVLTIRFRSVTWPIGAGGRFRGSDAAQLLWARAVTRDRTVIVWLAPGDARPLLIWRSSAADEGSCSSGSTSVQQTRASTRCGTGGLASDDVASSG